MDMAEFLNLMPSYAFSTIVINLRQPIQEKELRGLTSTMGKRQFISRVTSTEEFSTMEILNAVGLSTLQETLSSMPTSK